MDFFKPGSTLKREDPKAHSYERSRARDSYKKQLEIFKIRFEHELANHKVLDFDAKQEIRIKAKGMREKCLANYRQGLQGLATTNHRRNYTDLFLGTRETSFEMHDTTILDYELRLTHEMDTIISNLSLMKEDKSNRETLDWMASLARQKFSYELFEMNEHPKEVDITLELEPQQEPEPIYPYDEDMLNESVGPICASRISPPRFKSSYMRELMKSRSQSRAPEFEEEEEEDQLKDETFNREFNLITQSPRLVRQDYENGEDEELWRIRASPAPSFISDYHDDRDHYRDYRSVSRQPSGKSIATSTIGNSTRRSAAPVDVDNEEDVEEFLARSRALIRRSNKPVRIDYDDDEEDE